MFIDVYTVNKIDFAVALKELKLLVSREFSTQLGRFLYSGQEHVLRL